MVAFVMVYVTAHQSASDHAATWRAFTAALAAGACWGMVLVRFVPVFGGSPPSRRSLRTVLLVLFLVSLIVVEAIGRVAHQTVPLTMGFIAGTDAILATVLLMRSLRSLSEIARPSR
jgi:FtsH-binding integral membrane protein